MTNEKPSSSANGTQSELVAALWLMKQGYEVFRNLAPVGPVDLVGLKDGKTELFDVKTAYRAQDGRPVRAKFTQKQKELGVKCICVFADGSCAFDDHQSFVGDQISRVCKGCGKEFIVGRWISRQKFCSGLCGTIYSKKRRRLEESSGPQLLD